MTRGSMWVAAALFAASVTTAVGQQPQAKPAPPQQPQGKPAAPQPPQAKPAQPQQPQAKAAQQAPLKKGPYGWLDKPADGSVIAKKARVYGWALSDQGKVKKIEILLDGKPVKANVKRIARGGICTSHPAAVDCPKPGFAGEVNLSRVKKGPHTLSARFTDSTRAAVELGKKNVTIK